MKTQMRMTGLWRMTTTMTKNKWWVGKNVLKHWKKCLCAPLLQPCPGWTVPRPQGQPPGPAPQTRAATTGPRIRHRPAPTTVQAGQGPVHRDRRARKGLRPARPRPRLRPGRTTARFRHQPAPTTVQAGQCPVHSDHCRTPTTAMANAPPTVRAALWPDRSQPNKRAATTVQGRARTSVHRPDHGLPVPAGRALTTVTVARPRVRVLK